MFRKRQSNNEEPATKAGRYYIEVGCRRVWAAPILQGLIWVNVDRRRLRSCVRTVYAVHLTASPDEVRLPGPNQNNELESPDSTSGYPGSGPV